MALHSINSTTDVEATINALEASANVPDVDSEETVYSLDELHPEGEYDAEIVAAKEVKGFIVVELETSEGLLAKFYSISNTNGKVRLDPYMRYLLKAAGVVTKGFALSSLVGKCVTATVKHYEKDGELSAGVTKIQ